MLGSVLPLAAGFCEEGGVALELAELGADGLGERSNNRGTRIIARRTAAAALTRKSLLERGVGLGLMTRRGLPIVAFTCGSEVTGIGARDFGETGDSGTASGSTVRGRAVAPDGDSTAAAIKDSGESGAPGGRMYGDATDTGFALVLPLSAAAAAGAVLRFATKDGSRRERTSSRLMRSVASSTSAERTISA